MNVFQITLFSATVLCSLVAGFLFAFAIVVMPGIKTLDDREFIKSFQVMDRVIQNRQPVFLLVWIGSILTLFAAVVVGLIQLSGFDCFLLIAVAALYLGGVQIPTGTINVPLNNELQTVNVDHLTEPELQEVRRNFESPWNKWNAIRTVVAITTSMILMALLTGF